VFIIRPMAHWTLESNVADVLSLGPRTAGRLMRLGIRTVAQLLAAKPQAVAGRLRDDRFTAEIVADWQREAQLLLEVPTLAGNVARLLAAAGYASAQRVARATPTELLAALDQLATSPRPSVPEVNSWIQCAQQSLADRAA